ncbi:MAG: hypothetical protein R2716_11565 [Microthrixaceae bacterium]
MATALAEAEEFTSLEPDAPVDPAYGHMDRSELLSAAHRCERIGDVSSSEAVISHRSKRRSCNLWCARKPGLLRWEGVAIADPHRDVAAAAGRSPRCSVR